MTDDKTDRYRVTLSDGSVWEYSGMWDGIFWALENNVKYRSSPLLRTADDYRKCAEVIERWDADHRPRTRRRVVEIDGLWYARHETLRGYVYALTSEDARERAQVQKFCDAVCVREDEALDVLLSLRHQPDEEVPRD